MNFCKDNTIILIGRSDYLDKVDSLFPICLDKYKCATINWACTRYYSEYFFFLDSYVKKMCLGKILGTPKQITVSTNIGLVQDCDFEIYDQHRVYNNDKIYTDNTLLGAGFTHDYAISYLIKQGYKNVILAGCADFETKQYAEKMNVRTNIEWKYSEKIRINSMYLLNHIFPKYINIYTLNPNSALSVKRITTTELLQ